MKKNKLCAFMLLAGYSINIPASEISILATILYKGMTLAKPANTQEQKCNKKCNTESHNKDYNLFIKQYEDCIKKCLKNIKLNS